MNTKHILRYAAAAVAALAATACSKDDAANSGTPENPDTATPFTITASFDDAPETRITMNDDGTSKIELKWSLYDWFYVVNDANAGSLSDGTLYRFSVSNISPDGKTADFTCSDFPKNATPAYAFYDRTTWSSFNPKKLPTDQFSRYFKNPAATNGQQFPLYGSYDAASSKLIFKPVCAMLKLNVTLPETAQGSFGKLVIASEDGSKIFYQNSFDITQEPIARAYPTGTTSSQTYSSLSSESLTAGETVLLYFPIGPATEPAGKALKITWTVGDIAYTASVTGGRLESGKCYPLTLPASKWTAAVQ